MDDIISEIETISPASNTEAWDVFNYFCGIVCLSMFDVFIVKNGVGKGFTLRNNVNK